MFIYIPQEILYILSHFEESFAKGIFVYFVGYIWGVLTSENKKVITNIRRSCFFIKKSISSWERFFGEYKWSHIELIERMFKLLMRKFIKNFLIFGKLLISVDTTIIAKNSDKMFGVWKWNNHSGNADAGQYIYGHHWGLLGLVGKFFDEKFLCFPLLMRIITGKKSDLQWVAGEKGIERMNFWHVVHGLIFEFSQWMQLEVRVVVDAYFANKSFIKLLMEKRIPVITRLRSNAVAHLDFEEPKEKKRGRPRKKGKRIKVFDLAKDKSIMQKVEVLLYGKIQKLEVYVKDLWMLELPQKVRTVVVRTPKGLIAFISTDLSLTAAQIIEIYGSRFSIEISIRDMKSHLGVGNYQVQSYYGILRYVHLAMIAFNTGKILLLNATKIEWLKIDESIDKKWVSILSFNWLRYGLKKYALGKIVLEDSAEYRDSLKKSNIKDALLSMVA
jgi:hypothetical protein